MSVVTCPVCQTDCRVTPGRRYYCSVCDSNGVKTWLPFISTGGLAHLSSMRASIARNFGVARNLGQDAADRRQTDINFGSLENSGPAHSKESRQAWHTYPAKKKEQPLPRPDPYTLNSWETDGCFCVLIENVETTKWHTHADGISVSVHGDILRVVDTRKAAPVAAVQELMIPLRFDPNLSKASSWGQTYKQGIGVELRFPAKRKTES